MTSSRAPMRASARTSRRSRSSRRVSRLASASAPHIDRAGVAVNGNAGASHGAVTLERRQFVFSPGLVPGDVRLNEKIQGDRRIVREPGSGLDAPGIEVRDYAVRHQELEPLAGGL